MTEKADIPVSLLDASRSTAFIEAWFEIVHLKQLYRKGWLERGVDPRFCESVAEHTFGNAMISLLLLHRHPELSVEKVLRLALVHDLGEAYVGDFTPRDNVDPDEKRRLEGAAVVKILGKVPGGDKLIADWEEYEAQASPEAKFVKQIDRLEFALQASVYDHQGRVDAGEFMPRVQAALTSAELQKEMAALMAIHNPEELDKGEDDNE
ncbi:MAG: HD domain-containing protein [Proteobacteria bacterium]|nr:HD domain-containing protein [Pseudomonadota bacterium]MDA1302083.1 HD domain-containing protein [Pseudomonadota bacterium]